VLPYSLSLKEKLNCVIHYAKTEVFADPIKERATAVIVCHNHPSGNLDPSREDRDITQRLKEAGNILGINVLDHIIFSETTYYSFLEHDEM
jgi:DNA repair protein RadC